MKKACIFLLIFLCIYIILQMVFFSENKEFAESDMYDEIMSRGKIRVGVNSDSKPFGFVNEKGEQVGYDVDLAHYIAQYIVKDRNRIEIIPICSSERLIKASTGEVDIVIASLTITPQRREVVEFSIPYDTAGLAVMVKKNSAIRSLSDLSGQNVGVIFGTTAEKNLLKMIPTANIRGFRTYNDAYLALKNGQVDAVTSDDTILSGFVIDDSSIKLLPKRYSKEPYGIAFKKGPSTVKLKENID